MPRATVSTTAINYDLKTVPEGFVKLKRMSYGQWIHRQDIALKMELEGNDKNAKSNIEMTNYRVAVWEFGQCIVEHNLTDDMDQALNFNAPTTLNNLDPKIGNEISEYIKELHDFDLGKSSEQPTT